MCVFMCDCCSAGGVTLLAMGGKITIVNTLESRLELLAAQVSILHC